VQPPADTASRGRFITIDGPEGGGKTTQAARLAESLRAAGHDVRLVREPGGTWLGERIRDVLLARTDASATGPADPLADAMLFNAARRQLVRDVVRPALAEGALVIAARFADSTLAYQGYGAGVPLASLRALADLATEGLVPDRTIILDVPVAVGLERKAPDERTRFEAEFDVAFHERVRAGFLAIAASEPERVVIVDATQPVDVVAARLLDLVADSQHGSEPGSVPLRTHG
jgi:dTMP kinase